MVLLVFGMRKRETGEKKKKTYQILESCSRYLGVEILAIEERIDLNGGLGGVGESTLSTLASSAQAAEGSGVTREILSCFSLELLLEVVQEVGVEVLSSQMGITSSSLDGEDTTLDV